MRGHEGHAIGAVVEAVDVRHQGHLVEKALERTAVVLAKVLVLGLEVLRRAHQFAQVLEPRLGLGCAFLFEGRQIARPLEDHRHRLGHVLGVDLVGQPAHQGREVADPGRRAPRFPARFELAERFEEPTRFAFRERFGPLEGGLANPARGSVDDTLERGAVGGVLEQAQVREGVLHLGAVVEAHAAHHHVGDVVLEQLFFEGPRLGVGAVEDRHVPVGAALRADRVEQFAHHVLRLVALVVGFVEADQLAVAAFGEHLFVAPSAVVGHHGRRAFQDRAQRAVVALELHDLGLGKVALEVEDVADVGAAPGVDRLIRVADDAEVPVLPRQLVHQLVLHPVRVLVLVDQHVLPALAVVAQHLGKALEELGGLEDQVAKIEGVGFGENVLIVIVEFGGDLFVAVPGAARGFGRETTGVLPAVDAPAQTAGVVGLGIEAAAPQRLLRRGERVGLVVDGEAAREPQVVDLPAQDAHAGGVEGGDPQGPGVGPEELLHPLAHLARGLVGEGHGEDVLGRDAADADQVGDAVRQHAGLAAARAGEHEQRTLGGLDRGALFGIQTLEKCVVFQTPARRVLPGEKTRGAWIRAGRPPSPTGRQLTRRSRSLRGCAAGRRRCP